MVESRLAHVDEQRQSKRNADHQVSRNWSPEVLHPGSVSLNVHKHQKNDGRDENVHTEEATDPIGEKLLEKQPEIQTVFAEKGDKLGVRKNRAHDAKAEVHSFRFHE
jgi:uncharacterized protein involved in exopolysaccharide biosynthesis